jgi:hypothetical protein
MSLVIDHKLLAPAAALMILLYISVLFARL